MVLYILFWRYLVLVEVTETLSTDNDVVTETVVNVAVMGMVRLVVAVEVVVRERTLVLVLILDRVRIIVDVSVAVTDDKTVETEVSVVGWIEVNVVDSVMVVEIGTVYGIEVVEVRLRMRYFVRVFGTTLVRVDVTTKEEVTVGAVLTDTET